MQIPDEVTERAWGEYLHRHVPPVALEGEHDAFVAGAEWARKEALREAAEYVEDTVTSRLIQRLAGLEDV